MATTNSLSLAEIQRHNSKEDCWIIVDSKVWDMTSFLDKHPGGPEIILQHAGADATTAYDSTHAPSLISSTLPPSALKGTCTLPATADVPADTPAASTTSTTSSSSSSSPSTSITSPSPPSNPTHNPPPLPPLPTLISAHDFTHLASTHLPPKTWAFYSSAATDLISHRWNQSLLRRTMLRPRILRNVSSISTRTTLLGHPAAVPFFIAPAAMARLAHRHGELALARAAGGEGVVQCISNNASFPLEEIVGAGVEGQPFFLQLYVNRDRAVTEALLRKARTLGVKAVFVTVDAAVPGKREADERIAAEAGTRAGISGAVAGNDAKGGGMGRLMGRYIDDRLCWEDLAWIKEVSGLPVVLKGVQTAEDARVAVRYGVEGIMLSNHGGRSLDTAQASILVLMELHKHCPEVFEKVEVYLDGGFERGTDILKAIALGATAVGIGRPFLYSLTYGQEGATHLIKILKDELETAMRLSGILSLEEASPDLLNTADVDHLVRPTTHPFLRKRVRAFL